MAKKKAAKPRNRAAQEATLINLRALKSRVAKTKRDIVTLQEWRDMTLSRLVRLTGRVEKLEERLDAQPTGNESVFPLE